MIQKSDKVLGVGKYKTRHGKVAEVLAVTDDGYLVGRYDVGPIEPGNQPVWIAEIWRSNGRVMDLLDCDSDIDTEAIIVRRSFWLNIYDDGPGLLRKTWEGALVEASREEKQPLCRVEVKIDSYVGEGLK